MSNPRDSNITILTLDYKQAEKFKHGRLFPDEIFQPITASLSATEEEKKAVARRDEQRRLTVGSSKQETKVFDKPLSLTSYQGIIKKDFIVRPAYVLGDAQEADYIVQRLMTKRTPIRYAQGDNYGGSHIFTIKNAAVFSRTGDEIKPQKISPKLITAFRFHEKNAPITVQDNILYLEVDREAKTITFRSNATQEITIAETEDYEKILELQNTPALQTFLLMAGYPLYNLPFTYLNENDEICGCTIDVSPDDPTVWSISIIRDIDNPDLTKRTVTMLYSSDFAKDTDQKYSPTKVSTQDELTEKISAAIGSTAVSAALRGMVQPDLSLVIPIETVVPKLTDTQKKYLPAKEFKNALTPEQLEEEKIAILTKKFALALANLKSLVKEGPDTSRTDEKKGAEKTGADLVIAYVEQRQKLKLSADAYLHLTQLLNEHAQAVKANKPLKFDPLEMDRLLGLPRVIKFNKLQADDWLTGKNLLVVQTDAMTDDKLHIGKLYIRKTSQGLAYTIKARDGTIVRGTFDEKHVQKNYAEFEEALNSSTSETLISRMRPFLPQFLAELRTHKKDYSISLYHTPDTRSTPREQILKDLHREKFFLEEKDIAKFFAPWTDNLEIKRYGQGDLTAREFIRNAFVKEYDQRREMVPPEKIDLLKEEELMATAERTEFACGFINSKGQRCAINYLYQTNDPKNWALNVMIDIDNEDPEKIQVIMICAPFLADTADEAYDVRSLLTPTAVNTEIRAAIAGAAIAGAVTTEDREAFDALATTAQDARVGPLAAYFTQVSPCQEGFAFDTTLAANIPTTQAGMRPEVQFNFYLSELLDIAAKSQYSQKHLLANALHQTLKEMPAKEVPSNLIDLLQSITLYAKSGELQEFDAKKYTTTDKKTELSSAIPPLAAKYWEILSFDVALNSAKHLKKLAEECADKNIGNAALKMIEAFDAAIQSSALTWDNDNDEDRAQIILFVKKISQLLKGPAEHNTQEMVEFLQNEKNLPREKNTTKEKPGAISITTDLFVDALKQAQDTISEGLIDFSQYPTVIDNDDKSARANHRNFGDGHGNTIKLLHFLIRRNILQLSGNPEEQKKQYKQLYEIYRDINALNTRDAKQKIAEFKAILQKAKFNNPKDNTELRFIGDILADRGGSPHGTPQLYIMPTFNEDLLGSLIGNKRYSGIILTNDNAAYFIFNGKVVTGPDGRPQKVKGINRQGIPKAKTAIPQQISGTGFGPISKTQRDKVVNQAMAAGRYNLGNDLLTLLVFNSIPPTALPVSILFSNHDAEFFKGFWHGSYWPSFSGADSTGENPKVNTLLNLCKLIEEKAVDKAEVDELVMNSYISRMKAIDYEEDKESFTVFMHAPNGLETIAGLAKLYNVRYGDVKLEGTSPQLTDITTDELKITINQINQRFSEDLISGRLATRLENEVQQMRLEGIDPANSSHEIPAKFPLHRLLWERGAPAIQANSLVVPLSLKAKDGTSMKFFVRHGHDGEQAQNILPNVMTLDNGSGQHTIRQGASDREKEFHLRSSGTSAPMPIFTPEKTKQLRALKRLNNILAHNHAFDQKFFAQIAGLLAVVENTEFANGDLQNITKLLNYISNAISGQNKTEGEDPAGTYKNYIDALKPYPDLYDYLTKLQTAFLDEVSLRMTIRNQLLATSNTETPNESKLDRALKDQAKALLKIAPEFDADQLVLDYLFILTKKQLENGVVSPDYQTLIGPTVQYADERNPQPNQFSIRYDPVRETLVYNTVDPTGEKITGYITQDNLPSAKLLFAELRSVQANNPRELEKAIAPIIRPYLPQIFRVTASRGHTRPNLQQMGPALADAAEHFLQLGRYKEALEKLKQLSPSQGLAVDYKLSFQPKIPPVLQQLDSLDLKGTSTYLIVTLTEMINIMGANFNTYNSEDISKFGQMLQTIINNAGTDFPEIRPLIKSLTDYYREFSTYIKITEFNKARDQLHALIQPGASSDVPAAPPEEKEEKEEKNDTFAESKPTSGHTDQTYKNKLHNLLNYVATLPQESQILYTTLFQIIRQQMTMVDFNSTFYAGKFSPALRDLKNKRQFPLELRIMAQEVDFQNAMFELYMRINENFRFTTAQKKLGLEVLGYINENFRPGVIAHQTLFHTITLLKMIVEINDEKSLVDAAALFQTIKAHVTRHDALQITAKKDVTLERELNPSGSRPRTPSSTESTPISESLAPVSTSYRSPSEPTEANPENFIKILIQDFSRLLIEFPDLYDLVDAWKSTPKEDMPPLHATLLAIQDLQDDLTPLTHTIIDMAKKSLAQRPKDSPFEDFLQHDLMRLQLLELMMEVRKLPVSSQIRKESISQVEKMMRRIETITPKDLDRVKAIVVKRIEAIDSCLNLLGDQLIAHRPGIEPTNLVSNLRDTLYNQVDQEAADILKAKISLSLEDKNERFALLSNSLNAADEIVKNPLMSTTQLYDCAEKLEGLSTGKAIVGTLLVLAGVVAFVAGIVGTVYTGPISAFIGYKLGMSAMSAGLAMLGVSVFAGGLGAGLFASGTTSKHPGPARTMELITIEADKKLANDIQSGELPDPSGKGKQGDEKEGDKHKRHQ